MEGIDGLKTKELEKRINERIALIKKVVNFIEIVTEKIGRQTYYDQESCNTHIIMQTELRDFTFVADTGHSMMGGDDFKVWYHPGKKEIDIKEVNPVFHVYYQTNIEKSRVSAFDSSLEWLTALNQMVEHLDEILAEVAKEKKKTEKLQKFVEEDKEKRKKLLERAKALML